MHATSALVIGALVLASPARADHTSVHVTASGEMAATDNLFVTGSTDRQLDMFLTVRPGVLYAYDAPQMIHDFSAEAEVAEYLFHSGPPMVTGSAGWKSLFLTGPRSQLTMTLNLATGLLSMLSGRTSSDQTTTVVIPSGNVEVQQADTAETLTWISGKHTRLSQGVLGRYGFTDDGVGTQTSTREVGTNLGFERSFQSNTVALDASVSYLRLERIAPIGALMGSRLEQEINPRATVSWRHDIDRTWSTNVDGGAVFVNPVGIDKYNPNATRRGGTFAVFGAQLAYSEVWGRAMLSARRDVSPNLFLAQNTINDAANLQLALPLPWLDDTKRNPKLAAMGSFGLDHTQLINAETGSTQGNFKVAHLDFTLGWTPRPGQTYGVRYEAVYQSGDPTALMSIPSFYRNTVYLTFALRYPDRVIGELPKRPRSLRSDRKDLLPVDGETFFPDVLDQNQESSSGLQD